MGKIQAVDRFGTHEPWCALRVGSPYASGADRCTCGTAQQHAKAVEEIGETQWARYEWIDVSLPGQGFQFVKGRALGPDEIGGRAARYREWMRLTKLDAAGG